MTMTLCVTATILMAKKNETTRTANWMWSKLCTGE